MKDVWTDKLSEYLDGGLQNDVAQELDRHLASCDDCRSVLADLERVAAQAKSLGDRPPSRDLWGGVLEEIKPGGVDVIDLGVRLASSPPRSDWSRRREFSIVQLAAASVILMLISGGAVWATLTSGPDVITLPDVGAMPGVVRPAATESGQSGRATGLASLEQIVLTQGDRLPLNTLRILEKNLAAIDRAIEESRAALHLEPGNPFLESHLEGSLERREQFLREAASLLRSAD